MKNAEKDSTNYFTRKNAIRALEILLSRCRILQSTYREGRSFGQPCFLLILLYTAIMSGIINEISDLSPESPVFRLPVEPVRKGFPEFRANAGNVCL